MTEYYCAVCGLQLYLDLPRGLFFGYSTLNKIRVYLRCNECRYKEGTNYVLALLDDGREENRDDLPNSSKPK